MSKHPISDRAEVALDFPEKTYMGSFTRHSSFEAGADKEGVAIKLLQTGGDRREIDFHIHYHLFGDILKEIAADIAAGDRLDSVHRVHLKEAVDRLQKAVDEAG